MTWIGTDDPHAPVTADHLALLTDSLDARTDLHRCLGNGETDSGAQAAMTAALLVSVGDATSSEVVGGELDLDPVAREDADVVHAHLAGDVRQHLVAVLELDAEHRVGKGLDDGPLEDDRIFLGLGQRKSPARNELIELCRTRRALSMGRERRIKSNNNKHQENAICAFH